MGGRGGASGRGGGHPKSKAASVRTVRGVSVGERLFATETEVAKMSQNTIWAENTSTPHALMKNSRGTVQVVGNKKDKYGLLENVNTAVVHISGIDRGNPTREIAKVNKQLGEIRSRGFDVQRVSIGEYESLVFVKRKLFTKEF